MIEENSFEQKIRELIEAYIHIKVVKKIEKHTKKELPNEAIGFLIGRCFSWNRKKYTLVKDSIPLKSIATEVEVEPLEGALAPAIYKYFKSKKEDIIVGWYHSHPNYGCFLSKTDIISHMKYFTQDYHIALVYDPIRDELDLFKVINGKVKNIIFAIYK
ncbi:MAG: hypothetical protein DRJ52_07815 [Thermoprotei archaeon]|mgnify:CR=1 FL=1|nr:MAG: hypothetical protein DRJ52_07815 [Thermoprotei archaeon]